MDPFYQIDLFEKQIAEYTGAPYCVAVDCCTHAIELAMRYDQVTETSFSAYTYLSVIMIFHQLNIKYTLLDDRWQRQYLFHNTRIVDSARYMAKDMYESGTITCLSFGRGKPLDLHRGGALLLDDKEAYKRIQQVRYDGRNLTVMPWQNQKKFLAGFHYKLTPDEAVLGSKKLKNQEFTIDQPGWDFYPDTREIEIYDDWITGQHV
jgi:dTDP-4-amino-4,6-dideoxygalactose transaminase